MKGGGVVAFEADGLNVALLGIILLANSRVHSEMRCIGPERVIEQAFCDTVFMKRVQGRLSFPAELFDEYPSSEKAHYAFAFAVGHLLDRTVCLLDQIRGVPGPNILSGLLHVALRM